VQWVKTVYEFDGQDRDGWDFSGTTDERNEARLDLNAGRGAYLGFLFATWVLNWYEAGRTDRQTPFRHRITHDLQHDLLVYLQSGRGDEMAVFLILKALYVRD
jgi:hypothetical protein